MVANLEEAVSLTVSRLLEQLTQMDIVLHSKLTYKHKTGHDGAGNQSLYRSQDNPMHDPNIFSKMYVPLSLIDTETEQIVWKNESPNSAFHTRPLALIAEKESVDLIRFVNETFEPQEQKLRDKILKVKHRERKYKISGTIEDSMKDLKVRTIESGIGGAECLMCETQQGDWKNVDKIRESDAFQITRSAEKTMQLYKEMTEDTGEIKIAKDDYEIRGGLTSEPISGSNQHYLTLTHQYINGTHWFLNILYYIKANIHTWSVRGERNQEKLKRLSSQYLNRSKRKRVSDSIRWTRLRGIQALAQLEIRVEGSFLMN